VESAGDREMDIIEKLEITLKQHIDQLFGIHLYNDCIKCIYGHDEKLIRMTTQAFRNIMERGERMIAEAEELLQKVEKGDIDINALSKFEFLPISGVPGLDDMTIRAKLLVQAYEKLFPERPRGKELSEEEYQRLLNEAMKDFKE